MDFLKFPKLKEGKPYLGQNVKTKETNIYVKLFGALFMKIPGGVALRRIHIGLKDVKNFKFKAVA